MPLTKNQETALQNVLLNLRPAVRQLMVEIKTGERPSLVKKSFLSRIKKLRPR